MQITFLDSYTLNPGDLDLSPLTDIGPCDTFPSTSPEDILDRLSDTTILITNKCIIDKKIIISLSKLQFIQVAATGYNNIDLDAARSRNIPVSNVSGYSTTSVAQHTFAMLLGYLNKAESYALESRDGKWSNQAQFSYWHSPIEELSSKKLGIIGLGTIGREVAKIGQAFGMSITSLARGPEKDTLDYVEYLDEETFYQTADVISLHCPLNDQTRGIISTVKLQMMKPTSILVNTSRGGTVNELDLKNGLERGEIAAALLDVLSTEPPGADHILLSAPNCYITPHQAWASLQARRRLLEGIVSNIKAFQKGNPQNVVNL